MANSFNIPAVLPNPDGMVISEKIDTSSEFTRLDIEMTGGDSTSGWHASNSIALADNGILSAELGGGATAAIYLGLSAVNTNEHYNTIDYAASINNAANALYVYEFGLLVLTVGVPGVANGDVIAVRKTGTQIEYLYNGVVYYTSLVPVAGALVLDNAYRNAPSEMHNITLTVNDVRQPIVVTSFVGSAQLPAVTDGWDHVRDTCNYAIAEGQVDSMWNQDFSDALLYTALSTKDVCEWRIHHPSDIQDRVRIYMTVTATVTGTITFKSSNSGLTVAAPIIVGANVSYALLLDIGVGGSFSDVAMSMLADAVGSIQVHDCRGEIFHVTALPSNPVVGGHSVEMAWPMGAAENGNWDRPLSASKAHHLIDTLEHLYARPKCIACWSGTEHGSLSPIVSMRDLNRWPWVMTTGGHNRTSSPGGRGRMRSRIVFHVKVVPDPVNATVVYFQVGYSFNQTEYPLDIPAGGATAWHTFEVDVNDEHGIFPTIQYPVTLVGLWPTNRGDVGRTTATVLGFSCFAVEA